MRTDRAAGSRERVLAAVDHVETDRPPVGNMGFHNWEAIRDALGEDGNEEAMQLLGLDLRHIGAAYTGPSRGRTESGEELGHFGTRAGLDTYGTQSIRPLGLAESVSDIEGYEWPDPNDFDYAGAADACRRLDGRVATRGPGWSPMFCGVCDLMGMERALEHILWRPELIEATIEQLVEFYAAFHTRFLDATADHLDFFCIGDDFAHDRGLIMSPECWRRLFRPAIARFFGMAKSRGLRTWFHCCGMMREILPDLIELGLDVLEPCQVHLPGMRPEDLKREFGKHITFFGAINTQSTLPYGTPDDVRNEVRNRATVLGRGGGYIVSSDHTVLADVPVSNVLAMYEAAGSYVR